MQLNLPVRTARLILRDLEPGDFDAIHSYASDPEVTRYMFYGPRTVAETRGYLERMLASQREQPRLVCTGRRLTGEWSRRGRCIERPHGSFAIVGRTHWNVKAHS